MKIFLFKYLPIRQIYNHLPLSGFLIIGLILMSNSVFSQTKDSSLAFQKLKNLSLEELINIDVTSVSFRPEKLTEVASAIQVITGEVIRRSGTTRLPEALQLTSNLQMAHVNSHDWAITARGFNGLPSAGGILANKLLVMIDGRSIYNPLFGGVYWDVQNTLLEDIDRIEVISGPGGTLWGANAVNGVINVVTKSAKETQGLFVSGAGGSFLQDHAQVRYGFRKDSTFFCRIYGQRFDQKNTLLENGRSSKDAWNMTQGGFRMDYYPSKKNTLTLQGDFYGGKENDSVAHTITDGQNIMAHFTHRFSEKSNLNIKAYYDRTWRITPNSALPFSYNLNTYNLDIQHRFSIGNKQSILWGGQYQFQQDKTVNTFNPLSRNMPLYSGFLQDEIAIAPNLLKLTIGSKFLYNVFTNFEVQPSARIGWTPNDRHTIWVSVSRAVRIPTRFDADITVTNQKFKSEKVMAYELGYRVRPIDKLSLSIATFFNHYNDIRSLNKSTDPKFPIILANSQTAESWGFEFSGNYQVFDNWRLRGGYTYFDRHIWATSPDVLPVSVEFESIDPKNQFMIQSILDLPKGFQLDFAGRYVDMLAAGTIVPKTSSYFTFDVRLAWLFKSFEFSLVGQNLLEDQHTEVGLSKIPRSIYGKITFRF
jgi:iron complex outermembrane receptor protein